MENNHSVKNTLALLLVLVIAIIAAWLLNGYLMDKDQAEIEAITETSESNEITDIESDLEFDMDAALDLEGFEA